MFGHIAQHHEDLDILKALSQLLVHCVATKYLKVKCEANCLTAEAQLELGHATRQWTQAQQQIYKRMAEKEEDQGVALAHSKPRPQADWHAAVSP